MSISSLIELRSPVMVMTIGLVGAAVLKSSSVLSGTTPSMVLVGVEKAMPLTVPSAFEASCALVAEKATPAPPDRPLVMAKLLAAPVDWPVSTSWKLLPFWTTEALTPMFGVLLMALARPSSVTSPVRVTATPPMVSVPALATMVES